MEFFLDQSLDLWLPLRKVSNASSKRRYNEQHINTLLLNYQVCLCDELQIHAFLSSWIWLKPFLLPNMSENSSWIIRARDHCHVYLSDFKKSLRSSCQSLVLTTQSQFIGPWKMMANCNLDPMFDLPCSLEHDFSCERASVIPLSNKSYITMLGYNVNTKIQKATLVGPGPLRTTLPCRCMWCSYHREMRIRCHKHHCGRGNFQTGGQTLSSDLEGSNGIL